MSLQEARGRMIIALDNFATRSDELALIEALKDKVGTFKVGLERQSADGLPEAVRFVQNFGPVFADTKLHDIPNTIHKTARNIARLGVAMFNLHATGGRAMMEAARRGVDEVCAEEEGLQRPKILAVTLLTSLDYDNLMAMGLEGLARGLSHEEELKRIVVSLAVLAQDSGMDGVIASPQEVRVIRKACGDDFLIVTPGVRPTGADPGDQKRIATPKEAILDGANYLVIGRPITGAENPAEAAHEIAEEIAAALAEKEG